MEIRLALPEDMNHVCSLWAELLKFYGKQAKDGVLQRSFSYAVSQPGQIRIYVAVVEGKIAGTASLHMGHYSTWNDNWYGHIEDVIVTPAYRRKGAARRLVQHIIEEARKVGLSRIELNALMDNTTARKLYESLGFKTDSVAYELPL